MLAYPSEVAAMRSASRRMTERIERLELENQRQREVIGDLLDNQSFLQRQVAELGKVLWHYGK